MRNFFLKKEGDFMMCKIRFLKVLGIHLLLFIALFLVVKPTQASSPDAITRPSISFSDINELAEYIQWEIKANENYRIEINMEDEDGNKFSISFDTNEYYEEYDTSDDRALRIVIGHDDDYANGTKKMYTSRSFSYLTSKHFSENNDITYNYTNEATVRSIYIVGIDFSLYSISLDDSDTFDDPCWQKDASDWDDLNDFENDGGEIDTLGNPYIQFNSTNISVTKKQERNYSANYPYPLGIGYLSPPNPNYFVYQQPYPYAYQQPFNPYGYQQSYNPYEFGYQQSFNPYSYQQTYSPFGYYGYQQAYNPYDHQQAYNPYGYGYQQPYNTYSGYQQTYNYQPYNYGYQPNYGWNQPYNYGWNMPYQSPYNVWGPNISDNPYLSKAPDVVYDPDLIFPFPPPGPPIF